MQRWLQVGTWSCRSLRGNVDRNIIIGQLAKYLLNVVPYVGTWIEMNPSSEDHCHRWVVPYVGTWIEICFRRFWAISHNVVPYVGTWIEISSLPEREKQKKGRSLRGNVDRNVYGDEPEKEVGTVVPYVGTWIEIMVQQNLTWKHSGRSLRGNVDRNNDVKVGSFVKIKSFPTWERG